MLSGEKKLPSEPIGDRSVQLLSYILYIRPVRSRPKRCGIRHSQDAISLKMSVQDIKTHPLYSREVYAPLSLLQGKESKPPFWVTIPGSRI
ncbi:MULTISPECIES: hypothetical protein [unclassified Microcoleus]|uniref:hypothetical protein n=1 Tax=unclassified Microcoleus TaxID=2642155 RepID=UPI002FCEAF62